MPYLLMTGATGFLGGTLMADLLEAGTRLAVIVRAGKSGSPRQRVETILQRHEAERGILLPRPVVIEGDLGLPRCGLDEESVAWVRGACDRVLHSAASLQFNGSDRGDEPWRTNVAGTRSLLELTRITGIDDFWHVSTAYVCGLAEGPVQERPSTDVHGFRNDYEASKHEAESLVRSAEWLRDPTFIRPAVIVGDSVSGATTTYHGLMAMLHLMTVIVRNSPADERGIRQVSLRLAMTGEEGRNLVPVDWVAAVTARLLGSPGARGHIFHLAPERLITIREIINFASSYLRSGGVEFIGHDRPTDLNPIEEVAYGGKLLYEAYEHTDPRFDTTNTRRFAGDIICPEIDEAMIHRFLAFGDADRWGKRRETTADVSLWVADMLGEFASLAGPRGLAGLARMLSGNPAVPPPGVLGIECLGPGGGGWTIAGDINGELGIRDGLPASGCVTRIDAERLLRFQRNCIAAVDDTTSAEGGLAGERSAGKGKKILPGLAG
jgi:nucleoside-diphosphate-sugar epimerase